jgi:hypothetical protein
MMDCSCVLQFCSGCRYRRMVLCECLRLRESWVLGLPYGMRGVGSGLKNVE